MQRGTHQSESAKRAMSLAQKGKPRKKHDEKTRKLMSLRKKEYWKHRKESEK